MIWLAYYYALGLIGAVFLAAAILADAYFTKWLETRQPKRAEDGCPMTDYERYNLYTWSWLAWGTGHGIVYALTFKPIFVLTFSGFLLGSAIRHAKAEIAWYRAELPRAKQVKP